MKKSAKSSANSQNTALLKRAENNITIVNCGIVLYALVLAFLHSMSNSSATVEGAFAIRRILMYCGIVGFMGIAAYSAYKSNKSFLKYSLMCLFVSVSSAAMLFCDHRGWGTLITGAALLIAFVFNCIYAYLTDKNLYYSSKKTQLIFKTVVGIAYALLAIVLALAFFQVI